MNKRILHLIFLTLFTASLFGQAVVVNSPSSIAGVYSFSVAQFGADLLSDVWTGDAVLIQNAGSNPNNGCDSINNKSELAGKIVLIDRGVCNFSFKVLNAQNYGAKAVIIFNNNPGGGTSTMGAGTFGASVTIPSAMLSYDDGVIIKAALANGPVNISMGNIRFANDLATNNRAGICHAPFGTYPAAWLKRAGDVVITPGASVTNKGQNLASNVKVNARINFTPNGGSASELYNQTSGDGLFVEVDSTNDVLLPAYDLNGGMKVPGKGSINYLISSDSTEQAATDNSAVSDFYLSSNLFGKARLAASGRDPMITNAYRRADGTNAEFLTGFKIPYGKGCKIDSILFYMSVSAPQTLAGLTPEATLYGWQDLNADNDVSNDELSFLALGSFTFDAAETRTAAVVRIPLEDFNTSDPGFVIPDDQFGVFIGVRYALPDATPFFGFDEAMDYTCNNAILEAAGTLAITDLPYIGVTGYDANTGVPDVDNAAFSFTGLTSALAAFMVLSGDCIITGTNQLSDFDAQLTVFPNPASSNLNVDLKLNDPSTKVVFNIIDQAGRLIHQHAYRNGGTEFHAQFNVEHLANGQYHLQIRTDKGFKQQSFEVLK